MSGTYDWLPATILECSYPDWPQYEAALFKQFCDDFYGRPPSFFGLQFSVCPTPKVLGRHHTFWHCITKDAWQDCKPEERVIHPTRCERIAWAREVLARPGTSDILGWREPRSGRDRPHLCLSDFSYLVVLELSKTAVALVTAYYVDEKWQRKQLEVRWNRYKRK